jgi:hypothetical protein
MSEIRLKHIFGIRTCLHNSIFYLNNHSYLYPSTRHIILYNIDYKTQRLINYPNEFDILESLCVSPNKQYLAIGLNTLDKSRIIIYQINEFIKRRKIILSKYSKHILSIVFSSNSKYLLGL